MTRKRFLLVSVDMKMNSEVAKYIESADNDVMALLVIDPSLLQLITDIFVEKGWLGGWSAKELSDKLMANQVALRTTLKNDLQKELRLVSLSVEELSGNLRDIVVEKIAAYDPDELIFIYGKGFNPIFEASKPIIEKICETSGIVCRIFR